MARGVTIRRAGDPGSDPIIVVSAKVSKKAVLRNKIKRRIRDIIKDQPNRFRGCKIIAGPGAVNLSYQNLKQEINKERENTS